MWKIHTAVDKIWFCFLNIWTIPFDLFTNQINFCRCFYPSNVALYKWEEQDRTNKSQQLWLPRQIPSSQQGTKPNFVQEKMIGDMGHICRVTLGLPILERLKQMIVHLTTVVRNWQIVFHPGSAGRGLHLPTWGYRPLQTSRHPISWRHFHRFGISAVYNLHKIGTKMFEICAEMWHNITIAWCRSLPR